MNIRGVNTTKVGTEPLFSSLSPAHRPYTELSTPGQLAGDGVFFIKSVRTHCYFHRSCTFPGCSHRHEDKRTMFDLMLLSPRRAAKIQARASGHKHKRALYAAARRRNRHGNV
jgi:hypothetical protein